MLFMFGELRNSWSKYMYDRDLGIDSEFIDLFLNDAVELQFND